MNRKPWLEEWLKHAALTGLFIILPLLVASGLGYHTLWMKKERRLDLVAQNLETSLSQVRCEADAEVFLKKLGRGVWHLVNQSRKTPEDLARIHKSVKAFVPVDFDMYVFGNHGKLLTPDAIPLRSRFLGGNLWKMISCDHFEASKRFQKLRRQLKAFLGNEFRMAHFLDGRDSVTPIVVHQNPGQIYWVNDKNSPECGILLIFWALPDMNFRLQNVLHRMRQKFSQCLVVSEAGEIRKSVDGPFATASTAEPINRIVVMGQKQWLSDQGILWCGRAIDDLWVVASLPAGIESLSSMQRYLLAAAFFIGLFAFFIYFRLISDRLFLSIRTKLLALFLVAVISPVMCFTYLSYRYLLDRESSLLAAVISNGRRVMVSFDETFRQAGASFIEDFREIGRIAVNHPLQDLRSLFEPRIRSNDLILFELRNASDATVLFSVQNELVVEGMRQVSEAFTRFCLDNRFGSSLTDSIDPLLEAAVLSPEAGLLFLFKRPDEVHRMFFGSLPMFIYWNVNLQQPGHALYIYILQSAARLVKRLLKSRLQESWKSGNHYPYTLAAMESRKGTWLPAPVRQNRQLRNFADRIIFSDRPEELKLEVEGEEYLVLGQRSVFAPGYCLFSFYPYRLIAQEIAKLRKNIALAIAGFLLLSLISAWMLSDIFLLPVARLGNGVAAIKARNTDFRIVPVQHDEFGDLAISFNQMIADLKEMKLAQDVQESLLPAVPPVLDGYRLAFTNRMASAVGGDYFDVLVPDKNTVCIIIGDVTGHGVSSALVMAMAKAIVYQSVREGRDLANLFADLNRAIYAYFSRPPVRKMITLFAATMDLATGKGLFVNAGHNFPIMLGADGSCTDLASVNLPVGAMKNIRRLDTCEFSLNPGATIVFYTDGLIEVTDPAKEQYGYSRLKDMLATRAALEPEKLAGDLMAAYDAWLAGGEPDDDVTLIILQRQAVV